MLPQDRAVQGGQPEQEVSMAVIDLSRKGLISMNLAHNSISVADHKILNLEEEFEFLKPEQAGWYSLLTIILLYYIILYYQVRIGLPCGRPYH